MTANSAGSYGLMLTITSRTGSTSGLQRTHLENGQLNCVKVRRLQRFRGCVGCIIGTLESCRDGVLHKVDEQETVQLYWYNAIHAL